MLKNINITYKFVGYLILLSIVPILVISFVSLTTASNIVREQNEAYTQEIVANQLDYLDLEQSQIESLVGNISGIQDIRDSVSVENTNSTTYSRLSTEAKIGYVLNGYLDIEGLVSIDIFAENGEYYTVGDTLVAENIREDIHDDLWQKGLNSDKLVFWAGIENNINADSPHPQVITAGTIFYRYNRDTAQQDPQALLLVNYSVPAFAQHYDRIDFGDDTYLIVLDTKGRLVYHPDANLVGTHYDPQIVSQLKGASGTLTTQVNKEDVSISYARSARSGWIVASLVPVSTFEDTANPIRNVTLISVLAIFVFVAMVAYLYNKDIVAPIQELTRRFKKLEEKNLATQSYMPERGRDEIGKLIEGFNLLVDSLIANRKVEQEREKLISDLQVAMNFAEESSRLKSQFLATISHELRTPLNAIIGYSGIIVEGYGGEVDDEAMQMILKIYSSSDHLNHLIDDLLDLSKIEAGYLQLRYKEFDLREAIEIWAEQMTILANQSNLEFSVDYGSTMPLRIVSDESRIKQVLTNLVSNAIKFTNEGSVKLTIETRMPGYVTFEVSDTGIGIPSEAIDYIFEEFRQIDGSYQRLHGGVGLGLTIVGRIVKGLAGTIDVKSEVGKGSVFTIHLPIEALKDKQ